ncbi:MAG: SPASM domain-containing protein, partial [Rhodospirillales bacterium]|nr:SPASM domain-containing protein [Rhodospirillales bacterium]
MEEVGAGALMEGSASLAPGHTREDVGGEPTGLGGRVKEFLFDLAFPKQAVTYHRPLGIFNIELTNRCPFKCVMCARTNNMTRSTGLMEFSVYKKVIDELVVANPKFAQKKKDLSLHGFGESLVHPEFDKFISYGVEKGIHIGLSMNPLMMTEPVSRRIIEASPSKLLISMDGHDDESFFKVRGIKNAFDKSKEHLLRFLDMNRENGKKILIELHMIGFPLNNDSYEKMKDYWSTLDGIDIFTHREFSTFDGMADDVNELVGKKTTFQAVDPNRKVTCRKPWWRMTVTWDGYVLPCCLDYDNKIVLGNVKDQTLEEIWNSPRMKELRREFLSGN